MNVAIRRNPSINLHDVVQRSPFAKLPGAELTLRECISRSEDWRCAWVDGEVACVWGVIPPTVLSDNAWLWLLHTDIADKHKFLLVRYSQRYIEEALKRYPIIIGDCDIGNKSARKWVEWLGAEFAPPVGGKIPFVIRTKAHELR